MVKDSLGDRMKSFYENPAKLKLTRRTPVIIRLDGRAFHTFTKGMKKPIDAILVKSMQETMQYLCKNIQGCVLGYTQSDEITLVLIDYQTLTSSAWFEYDVQKLVSISASMATLEFNRVFMNNIAEMTEDENEFKKYARKLFQATFDARALNIPKEEVTNCILWRQLDAERNSIQSYAQSMFSHKQLQNLTCSQLVDKMEKEKGLIWGNEPTTYKRGSCCIKKYYFKDSNGHEHSEDEVYQTPEGGLFWNDSTCELPHDTQFYSRWIIDNDIPRFVDSGRDYIERLIHVGE
jgi:tRNA(His) 5'-end guanylyltransferase